MNFKTSGFSAVNAVAVASIFDLFISDLFVVITFGIVLINSKIYSRILFYLITLCYLIVTSAQLTSMIIGREYISLTAIENITNIAFLVNTYTISAIVLLIFLWSALIYLVEKYTKKNSHLFSWNFFTFSCLASLLFLNLTYILPENISQQREIFLQQNSISHTSPARALYEVLSYNKTEEFDKFKTPEINEIIKYGFTFNEDQQYPLIRDFFYDEKEPFETTNKNVEQPNIIIFFMDGISARSLGIYNKSIFTDLTPHIDSFAEQSMVVNNFYNHTAATYRALVGILCSLYPVYSNVVQSTDYYCLTDVFNQHSYDTVFFDVHRAGADRLQKMMGKINFKKVYTAESLYHNFNQQKESLGKFMTDIQLVDSLIGYLEKRLEDSKLPPLFLSIYNLGTHAFRSSAHDGITYNGSDNAVVNNIHNLDYAFGIFWEYFKHSPYAQNTIIILTTDHAHYPEKDFIKAFRQPGYQYQFIDQIPLIIYDQTRDLPSTYDPKLSTSIDFAPSLLHYLHIPNQKNPFMGKSIFLQENGKIRDEGVAKLGRGKLFIISEDGSIVPNKGSGAYRILYNFLHYTNELEIENRIWDRSLNLQRKNESHIVAN